MAHKLALCITLVDGQVIEHAVTVDEAKRLGQIIPVEGYGGIPPEQIEKIEILHTEDVLPDDQHRWN